MLQSRRALVALALIAAAWAAVLRATGGFSVKWHGLRLSAHTPRLAVDLAVILLVAAAVFAFRSGGWAAVADESRFWTHGALRLVRRHARMLPAILVVLVAAGFQIHRWSGGTPLWLDEQSLWLNLRDRGVTDLAGPLWLGQSAPLGWLFVGHTIERLFGTSELAVRVWPLAFSLATLATALWIGRRWLTGMGAFTLAWCCAFSQWLTHFAFEAKQYSSDACGALVLPAVAAWALEGATKDSRRRRVLVWWSLAGLGVWLSNGAMLATPALATILILTTWRRDGWRASLLTAASGTILLAAFALHYEFSGKYTLHSPYLQTYWAAEMPVTDMGVVARLQWALSRLPALAQDPGGTRYWMQLWLGAAAGFVVARRRTLGVLFASTPVSAIALGAAGVIPFTGRIVLWTAPALFVGIALLVDRAAAVVARLWHARARMPLDAATLARAAVALVLALGAVDVAGRVGADQIQHSASELFVARAPWTNHALDDRSGVAWLMRRRQPGDLVLSTHLGWPALWWYGSMSLSDPHVVSAVVADGSEFDEVSYSSDTGPDCRNDGLGAGLAGHRRVVFYLGFPDEPAGFDRLLVRRLSERGSIVEFQRFTSLSIAGVVDLTAGPDSATAHGAAWPSTVAGQRLDGCVTMTRAERW